MAARGYLVFTNDPAHRVPGDGDLRFVKDGFSWPALLVPLPWILWHRMWLTLVWYVAWLLVVAWVGRLLGEPAGVALGFLGGLLFAFEANEVRRRSLLDKGWTEIGPVSAGNRDEAELRIVAGQAAAAEVAAAEVAAAEQGRLLDRRERAVRNPSLRWDREPEVIGLFPEAERP